MPLAPDSPIPGEDAFHRVPNPFPLRLRAQPIPPSVDHSFTLDRSALTLGTFADEPDDLHYWLGQPAESRLAGIEFLRRQFYSDAAYAEAGPELRRLLELAQRPPR